MKLTKILFVTFLILLTITACNGKYNYNLRQMGVAVKKYLNDADVDNFTTTKLSVFKPLSYKKYTSKFSSPANDTAYVCKIYIRGTWKYIEGGRIYNVHDTLTCYFNNKFELLQPKKK